MLDFNAENIILPGEYDSDYVILGGLVVLWYYSCDILS